MVYADNAATTKLDKDALAAMLPWLQDEYGNASQPYSFARKPKKALTDAINYITDRGELFCFHVDRDQYQIPFQEIMYFESRLRKLMLHTTGETYSFYGKLNAIEKDLNPLLFVRAHASYLVNMEYIRSIRDTEILLQSGEHIPMSRKFRLLVRQKHLEYIKWRSLQ